MRERRIPYMKKRTAIIAALVSLMSVGQPVTIATGVFLSSVGLILTVPNQSKAESIDFLYERGNSRQESGDFYGALSDFTRIIETNPRDAGAYYNRGNAKSDLEDYHGAIADYTKAIELDPDDADFYYNRGNVKSDLEDYYGAISDFNKAIEINPMYSGAYYNRGTVKGRNLGDNYGAIADFTKAIEIDPSNTSSYVNRGITKEKLGDMKGACSDWKEAASLGHQRASRWIRNQC